MPPTPRDRPTAQHRAAAADTRGRCAVLTVSDTRTPDTDEGGKLIRRLLEAAGHTIAAHALVPDDPDRIAHQLDAWLQTTPQPPDPRPQVILTTGGTGIASRDTTIEVVEHRLTKALPGFGELFRMLSYEQVGPAAMLSRAVAGLAGPAEHPTLLFALPGSTAAVELALAKLILPELPHLLWEMQR